MSVVLPGSRPYVAIRLALWSLLWIGAFIDGVLHRTVRRRGWQLHWTIIAVIFFYVVQDVLLTTVSFEDINDASSIADKIFYAFLFFTDFADALFIGLLLLIGGGFGITRDNFGPYFRKIVFIPLGYFVTSLIVDTVIYAVNGRRAFKIDATERDVNVDSLDDWQIAVLFICQLASLAVLLLAWIYIFDTISRERENLEGPQEGIMGVAPAVDLEAGRRASAHQANGETSGHAVNVPDEVLLRQNDSHQAANYANMSVNDTDEPKTVVERLDHRSKVTLMKSFIWGVTAYVVATAAVILVPLFVAPTDPQSAPDSVITFAILIGQDCVLWLFLAILCFIFRPRADNPYLMLDEDNEANTVTGLDDAMDSRGATELVPSRSSNPAQEQRSRSPTKGRLGSAADAGPRGSGGTPTSIDHNFTLGNEDEEMEGASSGPAPALGRAGSKPGSSPKAGAGPRPKPVKERKD
ncbi:hypothetical protein WJX84_004971 [Apatococcus fuscideae]|uniref:Uncharacterized protein n=1 Tax=Apatococcus fuscideae TaxID=2026836 RepID=A0AAW1SKF4_9CHLO